MDMTPTKDLRPNEFRTLPAGPDAAVSSVLRGIIPRSGASPAGVLAFVCVGIVLANLDLFIVNVGLPNIARDFTGATLEDLSWILNGYAIAYAALLVFSGGWQSGIGAIEASSSVLRYLPVHRLLVLPRTASEHWWHFV